MKKLLWVKFGWSEFYRGGPVDGNFGWLNEQRGKRREGRGHEAYNFAPNADEVYQCYVPPQLGGHAPWNEDNAGWTVVCLAKNPRYTGIHIVGWYENATLIGKWLQLASDRSYCIKSKSVYFIPEGYRRNPFSDPSVRRGKYSFLSGPGISKSETRMRIGALLERRLEKLKRVAVHNPTASNTPDPENNPGDPLAGFGTPEHRKRVERAAEKAVVRHYKLKKFASKRVANCNCGYDYMFRKGSTELHVEVKGTSTDIEKFYLTRNEHKRHVDSRWRLAIVTNALSKAPNVRIYNTKEFKATFDLDPYVFIGKRIAKRRAE